MQTPTQSNISSFENKRILIVGDIMLDKFVFTTSERNSPEYKDIPILSIKNEKQYLGGAGNVALNLKKLKAIPYLVSTIGDDESGKIFQNLLLKAEISNAYLHTNPKQKTTVKTRIFRDKHPVCRIDEENKIQDDQLINHFILKYVSDAIRNHKPHAIILQDYNKGILNAFTIKAILNLAKQHYLKISVDPKFDNWELYQEVDLFKPNKSEFSFMSNCNNENDIDFINNLAERALHLKEKIHFRNLLVTLGSKGNFSYDGNKSQILNLKSQISSPDVCGAGDTVIAVATLGLVCNFSLEQIAELSNKAGSIVCQKENIQPILWEEL